MGEQVAARSTDGGLAQLGEHLPCKQGVESSNLLVSIVIVYKAVDDHRTYLENRILKIYQRYQERHPRPISRDIGETKQRVKEGRKEEEPRERYARRDRGKRKRKTARAGLLQG